jgi:hypothetical protein
MAITLLRAALENTQMTGERYLQWRLHAGLGRVYHVMSQGSDAEQEFTKAREHIRELADSVPEGDLRDNFLRRAQERLRRKELK